jgi:hypothetical protein
MSEISEKCLPNSASIADELKMTAGLTSAGMGWGESRVDFQLDCGQPK